MKMFKKFLALTLALLLCSTTVFAVCADDYGDNETPNDWNGIKYTITVVATPAEGGIVTGGATVAEGSDVTITATANEGYEFIGWYLDGTEVSTDATYSVVADADKTYTAEFELAQTEPDTYTITAKATEGGSATGTATVVEGESVTLTATANSGYKFLGWYDGETKVSAETTFVVENVTADKTYVATFKKYNGNVDKKGGVNALDYRLLLKYVKKLASADDLDLSVANIDGKSGVNALDYRALLKYVKKLLSDEEIDKYNLPPQA